MPTQFQYPLREKRKQRSRAALIDAAGDLFSMKGYEDTTLEEVAARAGLHVQTLYRHFASKPDLAAAVEQSFIGEFHAAIQNPRRTSNTFQFWRDWIKLSLARVRESEGGLAHYREVSRQLETSPAIYGRLVLAHEKYEALLSESLAADFGLDPARHRLPRLVGCMLFAANRDAVRAWSNGASFDLEQELLARADEVAELFDGYLIHSADGRLRSRA